MPKKYWATLPETRLIPELVRQAPVRTSGMVARVREVLASMVFLPARRALLALAEDSLKCQACPLHARATQAVFGEGSAGAPLMRVGE